MSIDISRVHGIVVPMITPLNQDESIDDMALVKITDYVLNGGVHGIFVNSTTGEGVCLTDADRRNVLKRTVKRVNGQVPVYANISDNSTRRTILNLKEVEKLGADIAVIHPPYYYPPNCQEELLSHFKELLTAASIPVMLYNIPVTTKAPLSLPTIRQLLEFDNLIGIKDSSVDFVFLLNLIELKRVRPDFKIFIGKTHLWTAGILSGADGGLDGISNLIPELCVKLYNDIQSCSHNVFELQRQINEIWRIYECRSFLGGIKAAMSLLGLCKPVTVKPILPASAEEMQKIKTILLERGVLRA